MTEHLGSCRCGGVAVKASGKTCFTGYCHCDDCRRSNGSPVASFAGFEQSKVEWDSRETLTLWNNGEFARHFCKACGSPVAYFDNKLPDVLFFYVGFMAEPNDFAPEHHSYHGRKIQWLALSDNLPKFEKTSYPRPE